MRCVAIDSRGPNAHGLGDIVDPLKDEIQTPRANSTPFEILDQALAQDGNYTLQIFGIAERLGKPQFAAGHLGRHQRNQNFGRRAQGLIHAQKHLRAEARLQTAARFARQLRDTLDAEIAQAVDGLVLKPQGGDWQAAQHIRSAARRHNLIPGEACRRPGAAGGIGDSSLGSDMRGRQPPPQIL
jgi:hypothetical protein